MCFVDPLGPARKRFPHNELLPLQRLDEPCPPSTGAEKGPNKESIGIGGLTPNDLPASFHEPVLATSKTIVDRKEVAFLKAGWRKEAHSFSCYFQDGTGFSFLGTGAEPMGTRPVGQTKLPAGPGVDGARCAWSPRPEGGPERLEIGLSAKRVANIGSTFGTLHRFELIPSIAGRWLRQSSVGFRFCQRGTWPSRPKRCLPSLPGESGKKQVFRLPSLEPTQKSYPVRSRSQALQTTIYAHMGAS